MPDEDKFIVIHFGRATYQGTLKDAKKKFGKKYLRKLGFLPPKKKKKDEE